jgi:hypothetical protein
MVRVTHFCADPLSVHAIYSLDVHDEPTIELEPLDTAARFALVGKNTYRYYFLKGMGLRQMHFRAAARFAKAVQVGEITRPAIPFMLDELVDRLEQVLGAPVAATEQREVS